MSPWSIRYAAYVLHHQGVIAYPTEAVFGLGCLPESESAIQRLLELKQRPADKGLILVAASFTQLAHYLQPLSPQVYEQISSSWPGPVTWVLPAKTGISPLLTGKHHSLAVRVSAHPIVRALCRQTGSAIISTSANLAGKAMAYKPLDVRLHFGTQLDFILHGPLGTSDKPTEIREGLTGKIIRY